MKTLLILLSLCVIGFSANAQKKTGKVKIITDEKKLNAIAYDLEEIYRTDTLNCKRLTNEYHGYVFYMTSFDPWGTIESRMKALAEFDKRLLELSNVYDCIQGKKIYLKLSEGLLLTDEERKQAYLENGNVDEKIHKIHLKRFVEKYGALCQEYFPGATIYVEESLW